MRNNSSKSKGRSIPIYDHNGIRRGAVGPRATEATAMRFLPSSSGAVLAKKTITHKDHVRNETGLSWQGLPPKSNNPHAVARATMRLSSLTHDSAVTAALGSVSGHTLAQTSAAGTNPNAVEPPPPKPASMLKGSKS